MSLSTVDFAGNIERFSGFANLYDRYRPAPPQVLAGILTRYTGVTRPNIVVDLGSGTGLSTRYWSTTARQVIGIDPTADMHRQAEALSQADNISYQAGFSHDTGLPDGCADIVTCSQSLHWMDPEPTFIEVRRILRDGGVFAAYDYDWPPRTGRWEADLAYEECVNRVRELESNQVKAPGVRRWGKSQHLARMQASQCFRYSREIVVHHIDLGNAERLHGLVLSQGSVMTLLKQGYSPAELGLERLKAAAERELGPEPQEWYWSSRVRIGIK
jgi:SAM-dependent methyltransferase